MNHVSVLRIAVPNPFLEGRNSIYVITSDPVTLIDTGVATDKAFQTLEAGLQEHGLRTADIRRVVLTHKHIDHIGNAWRIQRESGAEIYIHKSEVGSVTNVDPDSKRFSKLIAERLCDWNAPEHARTKGSSTPMPKWKLEPAEARGLVDGQHIEQSDGPLEVIHTPGHTMGSICLQYGSMLFTGDHVLSDISPNIGGGDMRQRGLLAHYFSSLERMRQLADRVQVMPGHGQPFAGLGPRCEELRKHHTERLNKTLEILRRGPHTVYEVARKLFGDLKEFHIVLGCAEAHTHLEFLIDQGQVESDQGRFQLPE